MFRSLSCLQGLTTLLYPLSVIKTRQMALEGSQSGLRVRLWPGLGSLVPPLLVPLLLLVCG